MMDKLKAEFVLSLEKFYREAVGNPRGIESMEYRNENDDEYVYVKFRSGSSKRFCVTCDSNYAIVKDFIKFLENFDDYKWIF